MDTKRVINRSGIPKPTYWTNLAKECYKRKNCNGCYYKEFFEARGLKCQMKLVVIESVKILGLPEETDENESEFDR